jgi:DNA-binding NarL/FixJ family response regulator
MKTVAIYSQQPVLARGMECVISHHFLMLGIFDSIPELRRQFQTNSADLLVVDMSPSVDLEILHELRAAMPAASIAIWVDAMPPEFGSQCLSSGVRGVLSKSATAETLIRCLTELAAARVWNDSELSYTLCDTKEIRLTGRERQLMGLLARGLRNKEIARALGITEGTVKVYFSKLFVKVGVNDRFDLALLALKNLSDPSGIPVPRSRQPGDSPTTFVFPASIHLTTNVSRTPLDSVRLQGGAR